MKKNATATALALLITGCAQQTFTVQTKLAAVAPKKPSPIIFWFLELGRRKIVDAAKICGGAENVVKIETQQNIRKWIARVFYYFRHLPAEACVLFTHQLSCPSIWQLYLYCSLIIYFCPFQLFLHSDWPSEGEIIPFSVCQSGEAVYYPRRRRWWLHALTDRLL